MCRRRDRLPSRSGKHLAQGSEGVVVADRWRSVCGVEPAVDDVTVATIMAAATADKLAALLERVANGELRVNIETTIPLDRAHDAFAAFADGTLGKVLITR